MHTLESLRAGLLPPLTRLQLAENLTEFPREIFQLADSLEILDLSNNKLSKLPEDFGRLHRLKVLFLSQNQFTEVPRVLAECPALSMIGFKSNQISCVPEGALPKTTRWLILTDNKIHTLPHSMGHLPALQKLMLAGNLLKTLPSSMAGCTRLELLRISANQLVELPQWLLHLPKLSWLAFAGNPFLNALETKLPQHCASDIDVHELLGEGASGLIHRATLHHSDTAIGPQNVALKLFKGEVTSDGNPLDELIASANTGSHPNIVHIFAKYTDQKQLGLLMDLIPQRFSCLGLPPSFETCTRDTFPESLRIPAIHIASIVQQIASAMTHLHQRKLCHGDLYTHNLLTDDQHQIMLGDFGAASLYTPLSNAEHHSLQRLEVRAFGCLIDDLLQRCDEKEETACYSMLTQLSERCMHSLVDDRPSFDDIEEKFNTFTLASTCNKPNTAHSPSLMLRIRG